MFGAMRPSGVRRAFQLVNIVSSSRGSWPRSARRTGWPDSGVTRYWYQEMSQATVTTTSAFTPDSGTTLALGSPRLFAIPATVRRNAHRRATSARRSHTFARQGGPAVRSAWEGTLAKPRQAKTDFLLCPVLCVRRSLDLRFLGLLLRFGDHLLRDVRRNFLVAQKVHVIV